ncbi:MAG: hypothetical protein RL734_1488, partial [Bacteroidota bacterium]
RVCLECQEKNPLNLRIYANVKWETQKKMYFESDNLDFWNNL